MYETIRIQNIGQFISIGYVMPLQPFASRATGFTIKKYIWLKNSCFTQPLSITIKSNKLECFSIFSVFAEGLLYNEVLLTFLLKLSYSMGQILQVF